MPQPKVANSFANTNDCPHIDDVQALNEEDLACLEEIAAVLQKHDRLDRFGLSLLHKHFDLAEDEVLVEYTDEEARTQTIRVEKRPAQNNSCIQQTAWRFKKGSARPTLGCYQTCVYRNGSWVSGHVYSGS